MNSDKFLELLKIVIWPIVALIGIAAIRPALAALLSGSKVKLSLVGQSIETTLPELGRIIEEQTGGTLTGQQTEYLDYLHDYGPKKYSTRMSDEEHGMLRPLRNYGIIMTDPKDATLQRAKSIGLTSLGRLFMQARKK